MRSLLPADSLHDCTTFDAGMFIAVVLLVYMQLHVSFAVECKAGRVMVPAAGSLVFPDVPRNITYEEISDYDGGPLSGWYSMAGGFVDAVRPGGLPYCETEAFITT